MKSEKVRLTGWRCAAIKLAMVPALLTIGAGITVLVPFVLVAGIFLLPFLPVYKTSGFGISLGEGEGEGE